jgi:hypothetical protein
MINEIRSSLFALYIQFLKDIEQNSSYKIRILLLFIMCGFTVFIKTTRVLLFYLKVNALRRKINPSPNEINQRHIILLNELQYRYGLNSIIILSYLVDIVLLESLAKQVWRIGAGCIIYFIMHYGSISLARSFADKIDDVTFCYVLLFSKKISFVMIVAYIIIIIVFTFLFISSF